MKTKQRKFKVECIITVPFYGEGPVGNEDKFTKTDLRRCERFMLDYIRFTLGEHLSFIPLDNIEDDCSGQTKITVKRA